MEPLVFERGDRLYVVTPLAPMHPSEEEIAAFAFAESIAGLTKAVPNPNLAWFAGHYVEADQPNRNGAQWTAGEIAIKHLTPLLMPVTVMHDPRTAVGTIADVSLKTPDDDGVPRAKLDTALALWAHRFPEAVEEAMHNYKSGSLMQSMECLAPAYDCSVCGMTFHKQPKGAERSDWCDHLKASNPTGGYLANEHSGETLTAVRILRNVCFTGTGLIYGTRGAKGADPNAHLEAIQEEVAEFHERQAHDRTHPPRRTTTRMQTVEIAQTEYDSLRDKARIADDLQRDLDSERAEHDKTKTSLGEAEKAQETAEADKVKAEERADKAEKEAKDLKEETAQVALREERMEALGEGFKAKLGEATKKRLDEQAKSFSDEEWKDRLEELAEAYGVKPDEGKPEGERDDEFSREETARSMGGTSPSSQNEPSGAATASVIGSLFQPTRAPARGNKDDE